MQQENISKLPDYHSIYNLLESERKIIVKVNSFSEDCFIREIEDAGKVLLAFQKIQENLYDSFDKSPSLKSIFKKEFMPFHEFIQREYILETCFLDDHFVSDKQLFEYVNEDGDISDELLSQAVDEFSKWVEEKETNHKETNKFLTENFNQDISLKELKCHCNNCESIYRGKLRDSIYDSCVDTIERYTKTIESSMEDGLDVITSLYQDLQKKLDKTFYKIRYRLKRSVINRLETRVKDIVKSTFIFPSSIAVKHIELNLRPLFDGYLKGQGLRTDLITEDEYDRFYLNLSRNIWRRERYLETEFKKIVRSILTLKRKDISANILNKYLGEFWVHSDARKLKRKIIYHMGPTNSGKTYHAIQNLCNAKTGCYLAPLRLLAAELYDTMNSKSVKTNLLTGEEVIETEGATHFSSTIEMAQLHENFDICVIDEIQMISDPQRGWAWTRALVNLQTNELHLCGDSSVLELVQQIVNLCGDTLEIKNYERMTKLEVEKRPIRAGELQKSDALIVFSRKNALKYKYELEQIGLKVSIVYGRLSPEVRREQARKFDHQETDVIVATDAIAMGMNLPIRRIVFSTLSKFFNSQEYQLSHSEIKQIAGRAGRFQRFPIGYVTCLSKVENGLEDIEHSIHHNLEQKLNCMVGPDLEIYNQVNNALESNSLPILKLSEFLRLFNTMVFKKPFFCVQLNEMIEISEMVEEADYNDLLSPAEQFGFVCAPVNLGLLEHVQYFVWILNHFVRHENINYEPINSKSNNIDYLETSIKCIELYQWLSRHFNNKNFEFNLDELMGNKNLAVDKLNKLLSNKIVKSCSSCGENLEEGSKFGICEVCFKSRRFTRKRPYSRSKSTGKKKSNQKSSQRNAFKKRVKKKKKYSK